MFRALSRRQPTARRSETRPASRFRPRLEPLDERALPSFLIPHNYTTSNAPVAMATADLNGDGALDLITAGDDSVSVLLGALGKNHRPNGLFSASYQSYPTGAQPTSLAVGDFNGNGKIDVVTGNSDGTISVLSGIGDGSFAPTQPDAVATGQLAVGVGDFNGDGRLDLAVAGEGALGVLLGNGDCTFTVAQSLAPGAGPAALVVGDFTNDGRLDVAAATFFGTTVSVLPGNGDGTVGAARTTALDPVYPLGSGNNVLASGDFNGDGTLDLAATSPFLSAPSTDGGGRVNVLLGNGDGSFTIGQPLHIQYSEPQAVGVDDFNGDGRLDLVTVDQRGYVDVWLGNGDGTFRLTPETLDQAYFEHTPLSLVAADFNGDGFADVAEGYYAGDFPYLDVEVLLNDGVWGGATKGKGHHK